jgi:chorismate mutase
VPDQSDFQPEADQPEADQPEADQPDADDPMDSDDHRARYEAHREAAHARPRVAAANSTDPIEAVADRNAADGRARGPRLPDPTIPYVHGRDLVPIRVQPRKYPNPIHDTLFKEEDAVRRRIRELDQQVLDLAAERRALLRRIAYIHDELRPRCDGARGRRRRAVTHEEPLPPAAEDAVHLIGRALRAVCVALLREAGRALTLRELHVVLHRLGYFVAHPHPAKALADALGHEADAGRAIRVQRATYRAAGGPPPNAEPPGTDEKRDAPLDLPKAGLRGEPRPPGDFDQREGDKSAASPSGGSDHADPGASTDARACPDGCAHADSHGDPDEDSSGDDRDSSGDDLTRIDGHGDLDDSTSAETGTDAAVGGYGALPDW